MRKYRFPEIGGVYLYIEQVVCFSTDRLLLILSYKEPEDVIVKRTLSLCLSLLMALTLLAGCQKQQTAETPKEPSATEAPAQATAEPVPTEEPIKGAYEGDDYGTGAVGEFGATACADPIAAQIGVDCPYIACNGAQLISSDHQVLEEETIPPETARAIVRYLQNEGFYVQVYRGEYFYYAKECGPSEKYRHSSGMKGQAVGDLLGFIDYPVPKILSVTDPSEVQRVMPLIKEAFRGEADFTMSKPFFIEGIAPNVSKGNALRRLAKRLDLTPENTMVFGDSLNDISMLNFSHNSVAMGNARAETKQAARFVCRSNQEDGVAHFVAEHVLGLPST